jgi:sigma-B regulation protein RsbU (phosphoserine phosphatase)
MNDERDDFKDREAVKLDRLELALRASNEGIWDWWIDRTDIYYSRRVLEFLECGRKHAPHLFLSPQEAIHPEDRQTFELALKQALGDSGPETLAVDARVLTGGGEWRWLRVRGTVVRSREGRAYRIAGSMIDISRRKHAEARLEDERFLLRQLIDHIPVQIYFKDLQSRFVMANQGMAEWMGFSETSEVIGKHDSDFFDEDHWKPAEEDEHRIIATGQPITGQLERETWNEGEETWVLTSKFPWRDRHGVINGTFGVSSDVTKLVKAQREASDMAALLQQKNKSYEEELLLAREIQQALTGQGFPLIANAGSHLNFLSRYIPISDLAGDFFQVIKVRQDCAGILICDVMGHGVRSALVVAMMRGLLEKQCHQATEPGVFLEDLNEGLAAILERAGTTMFATAFYGMIDLSAETFSYACAGHPGPIIDGPGGVRQLATERCEKGPGLGLIQGASYATTSMPLQDLQRMILFTDGVLEAENSDGEPYFEKRLINAVTGYSGKPLDETLDGILSAVLAFSGASHFGDDVCLLGVDISGTPLSLI